MSPKKPMMGHKPISFTINRFYNSYKRGEVDLKPKIQRNPVWPLGHKIGFIDTIFRSFPIPLIFVRTVKKNTKGGTDKEIYQVIDGQQRIRAIFEYIEGDFSFKIDKTNPFFKSLTKDLQNLHDQKFAQLSKEHQKLILNYDLPIVELVEYNEKDSSEMFDRLNRNVIKVNNQELRNSKYFGDFKQLVYKTEKAYLQQLLHWKLFTADNVRRMIDCEFISELYMYLEDGIKEKKNADIDNFYLNHDNTPDAHLRKLRKRFNNIMKMINDIFADKPLKSTRFNNRNDFFTLFCVMNDFIDGQRVINKIHYESIHHSLEKLTAISHKESDSAFGLKYYGYTSNRATSKDSRKNRHDIVYKLLDPIIPTKKDKKRGFSDEQRKVMWSLQEKKICGICKKIIEKYSEYELDHIKPHAKGFLTSLDNAQLSHKICNINKSDN